MFKFINGQQVFCGYKVYYNPETKKYEYETEPSPVLSGSSEETWSDILECAIKSAEEKNIALQNGSLKIVHCSDCGQFFSLDENEAEWYKRKGFSLPKRCFSCRDKRKRR